MTAVRSAAVRVRPPGGPDLAVYDFGGDGPDLVLAHATGFHARVWEPVARHLAVDFHCLAFDERAHGDSEPPPDGNFEWQAFATDALAVVDALGLSRPFGAGHSCGGALLLLAEQAAPGTFDALWCYEPVIFPVDDPLERPLPNPLAEGARRRRASFPSKDLAYENFAAKPPFNRLAPDALRAYVEHGFVDAGDGTVTLACPGEHEASTYDAANRHTAFRHLADVQCPVTVACGEQTDAFGAGLLAPTVERLPSSRLEVLPGLTHFGPLEDPEAIARSIRTGLLGR